MTRDLEIGLRCIHLYFHSRGEAQWRTHYVSVTGEWEWYFW